MALRDPDIVVSAFLLLGALSVAGCSSGSDLPKAVHKSLRSGDLSALEPFLADRHDFKPGIDSSFPESPPGECPASSPGTAEAARLFEQAVAQKLSGNVGLVRSYAARLGLDWTKARLEGVFLAGRDGSEARYKGKGPTGPWLTMVIGSGPIRMALLVSVRSAGESPKLLGNLAASALRATQRQAFREWQPGFDTETDRRMARSVIDGQVSDEWFRACSLGGILASSTPQRTVQLPAFFQADAPDQIWIVDEGNECVLHETGPSSLRFAGDMPIASPIELSGKAAMTRVPATLILKSAGSPGRERWTARIDGKDRTFSRLHGHARTYRSSAVRTVILGKTDVHKHTVEVTFTGGVVSRVAIDGQAVE